jgi:hypothetical protein
MVSYGFDFNNDGVVDNYSGYVDSGSSASASYSWSTAGTYTVSAVARDAWGNYSGQSQTAITIASPSTGSTGGGSTGGGSTGGGSTGGSTGGGSTGGGTTNPPSTINTAPNTPSVTGPGSTDINTQVNFTVTASDPQNDSIVIGVDWDDDGVIDQYSSPIFSGTATVISNSWTTPGSKTFKVYGRDIWGAYSNAASVSITINGTVTPPPAPVNLAPNTPSVSYNGSTINSNIVFTASATDPESDSVNLGFDWDDNGVIDTYTGFVPSGTPVQASHVWAVAGTYTVKVYATDPWNHYSPEASSVITVTGSGPIITNTAPNTPFVQGNNSTIINTSEAFTFTSTDPQGDDVTYLVDWDNNDTIDATSSTVPSGVSASLSHAWGGAGTYTFKVFARDYKNAVSDASTFTITVSGPVTPPPVNLAPSNPSVTFSGTAVNSSITFTALSTDPESDQVDYGFDWDNDGVIDGYTGYVNSGVAGTLAHTWNAIGTYTVTVYARDTFGHFSGGTSVQITITNSGPVVVNTAPNTPFVQGNNSTTINTSEAFTFTSTDPQGDDVSYLVDWNDDGAVDEATAQVPSSVSSSLSHSWPTAGTYTFKVYAKDSKDAISSPASFTITVTGTVNPPVNLAPNTPSVSYNGYRTNEQVAFTAVTTDPENDQVDYGFDWDNDGTIDAYTGYVNSGTAATLSHAWASAGVYMVKVYARDTNNQYSAAASVVVAIVNSTPVDTNTAPNTPVVQGYPTGIVNIAETFTVTATDPEGDQISYGFDWDNNGTVDEYTSVVPSSISQAVSHTWTSPGVYTFKVYARDVRGADSSPASFTITINEPVINLAPSNPEVSVSGSLTNTPITFTAISNDPEGDNVAYGFDWDNDNIIDEYTPFVGSGVAAALTHSWNLAGTYTVKVYAKDVNEHFSGATIVQVTVNAGGTIDTNTAPSTPSVTGSTSGVVNTNYTFTATSQDPQGDSITYGADWDSDGVIDETSEVVPSGTSVVFTRSWPTAGNKTFHIYAKDIKSAISTPASFTISISNPGTTVNQAPQVSVTGPSVGTVNTSYSFTATANDPENNMVAYAFDWDNDGVVGTNDESWSSFYESGSPITQSMSWPTSGIKTVAVFAKDMYDAISSASHQITITGGTSGSDINFTVTPMSGLSTSENGATAAFTVVLDSAPLAPVTFAVTSSDLTEGTVSPLTSITFTPANWNVTQTVIVTGVDDTIVDGDVSYTVVVGPSSSDDNTWNNLSAKAVTLTNTDNDSNGGGGGNNPGSVSSFTIDPSTITSGGSATLSWSSSNATLCIASGAWAGDKSVSGSEIVGPFTASVSTTTSFTISCGNANGTTSQSVVLTVNPDTTGGGNNPATISSFVINPSTITSGATSTISWSTNNANLCLASNAWSGTKDVSGSEVVGPYTATTTQVHTFTLECGNNVGSSTLSVTLTVNPTNGGGTGGGNDFVISPTSGLVTTEAGATSTFSIMLSSAPTSDVIIPVSTSDDTEGQVSTSTIVFTPSNWNVEQVITITGLDDTIDDGDIAYVINIGASTSTDPEWHNIPARTVSVTNVDNDSSSSGGGGGGSSSGGGGGGGGGSRSGPCIGYNCPTSSSGSNGGITLIPDQTQDNGIVLGYNTTALTGPEAVCPAGNYLLAFLRYGADNNPEEVRKLQNYLNSYEGTNLEVTGEFDEATEQAVKDMQVRHSDQILAPWGVTEPTGFVYITTSAYINKVTCEIGVKDTNTDVLNGNSTTTEGLIGQSTSTPLNLAAIGSFLKDIPWYAIIIILLILIGTILVLTGIVKKDLLVEERYATIIRGSAVLAIGTVLNVLNSLSFILNPDWFMQKTGLTLAWLIGLDIFNLACLILICLVAVVNLFTKSRDRN